MVYLCGGVHAFGAIKNSHIKIKNNTTRLTKFIDRKICLHTLKQSTHTQTLISIVWRAFKLDFVVETKEKAAGMVSVKGWRRTDTKRILGCRHSIEILPQTIPTIGRDSIKNEFDYFCTRN